MPPKKKKKAENKKIKEKDKPAKVKAELVVESKKEKEEKERRRREAKKITDDQIVAELHASFGIVSNICTKYDITRAAVWRRIHNSERLTQAYEDSRERLRDVVEDRFIRALNKGEKWAVEKGMDKLLHDRGYIDKKQIDSTVKIADLDREKRKEKLRMIPIEQIEKTLKQFENIFISDN